MSRMDMPSGDTDPLGQKRHVGERPAAPRTSGSGVLVFVALLTFMGLAVWAAFGSDDVDASRRALIFGGVASLASTALGWYFGMAVQRERVDHAEACAERDARDAENGRALAALLLAREGRVVQNTVESTLVDVSSSRDQEVRREYADAARLLFPYALGRTAPSDEIDENH